MSIFNSVLVKKPERSLFNLKHERKFSADFAWLYPICCIEAVPGDTFKLSTEVLVRCAPLIAPIMHRVNVKVNYFFVPCRLVWNKFPDFITGVNQSATYDPNNPSGYFTTEVPPFVKFKTSYTQDYLRDGSLADFLGYPTMRSNQSTDADINIQIMPFRAYQKIYQDWYRNQNVEGENWSWYGSGEQTSQIYATMQLRKRMWEKDYFTSALPFAQRGDPVPLPIVKEGSIVFDKTGRTEVRNVSGTAVSTSGLKGSSATGQVGDLVDTASGNTAVNIDNSSNLKIGDGAIGTINDLRIATRLQRWLEVNARVGGRYIEQILGHFGVHSSDARLQRAEYLGGWSAPIVVSDVEQTSAYAGTSQGAIATTPQGNLAGKGTAYGNSKPVKCFCEEHGFVIGLLSILPRTAYQDGLPRMFQRNYKEDYYFPEFAHLGEQEIKKNELFYDLTSASNRTAGEARFGFQERYCEYKYIPSTVHGEFKNNLQFWHLGRSFSAVPALNKSFVEPDSSPLTRVFAVGSGANHFYVNLINNVTALRPMPRQAVPTL